MVFGAGVNGWERVATRVSARAVAKDEPDLAWREVEAIPLCAGEDDEGYAS